MTRQLPSEKLVSGMLIENAMALSVRVTSPLSQRLQKCPAVNCIQGRLEAAFCDGSKNNGSTGIVVHISLTFNVLSD